MNTAANRRDVSSKLRFNNVELQSDSILAARRWFAENALACSAAARSRSEALDAHTFHVNDLTTYKAAKTTLAAECLMGEYDTTLAFMQKAYFIQTGACPALLP